LAKDDFVTRGLKSMAKRESAKKKGATRRRRDWSATDAMVAARKPLIKSGTVFSESEQEAIRSAARRVWDECGYDCLLATADEEGKPVERVSISRDQVIEIALDAGRAEHFLQRDLKKGSSVVTAEFMKRYQAAKYDELIAVVKPAFPFERYGL